MKAFGKIPFFARQGGNRSILAPNGASFLP
jgi:hypothetical protein